MKWPRLRPVAIRPIAASTEASTTTWRWALLGLLVGAGLAAAWRAPAQWLAALLAEASGGRLLLAEARGTVWSGSAVLVLAAGPGARDAQALPGRLAWTLAPGWADGGPTVRLSLQQACCLPQGLGLVATPGWGGWRLTGPETASPTVPVVLGRWPAAWLAGLGTPWNTLKPTGTMQLTSPGFEIESVQGRLRFSGSAELQLLDVAASLSTLPWLGDYRLALTGDAARGDAATVVLSTLRGALQLSGQGQIAAGRLRFEGQAEAAVGSEAALANLLNIIGRRQGARALIRIG